MDCTEVSTLLELYAETQLTSAQRVAVEAHLGRCDSCSSAAYAVTILRSQRRVATPATRPGLLSEVIDRAAMADSETVTRGSDRFWLGAGIGGALAAGIVFALLNFNSINQRQPDLRIPQLGIAFNETRDVNLAIDSPTAMMDATIRVVLTGTVVLAGFEQQSELQWTTDLDPGVNMLSLPVTMVGTSGGQVFVEVTHEDRHEIFVVTLPGSSPQAGELVMPSATTA